MKKLASILLVAAVLVCCMVFSATADETPALTVTDVSGAIGETVTVEVSISKVNITTYGIRLDYDKEALKLTEITQGSGSKAVMFVPNLEERIVGGVSFTAYDAEGVLIVATFEVLSCGDHTVEAVAYEAYDAKVDPITVESGKGTVSVGHTAGEAVKENEVPATCTDPGSYESVVCCSLCGTEMSRETVETEPAPHTVEHVEAVEPGCENEGNVEYWYCTVCGAAWLDEDCTKVTNLMSVKLPITHNIVHVEAAEPGCDYDGNIEHWYCADCGYAWLDEYLIHNTNLKAVVLPATGHTVEHVEAKEPTCFEEGNVEYWYCSVCGAAWLDEDCTQVTNLMSVKLGVSHKVEHVEAKEPTCFEEGNIEYWYCTECGSAWLDEYCWYPTNLLAVKLGVSHNIVHVEANECTCWENGNIEYWYCADCGYAWLDEYLHLNTNLMSVVLPCSGHTLEHVEAVAPTCTENGNVEYWYCTCCGYAWTDEACTQVTNLLSVVLPATGTHVDADEDEKCDHCSADLSNPKSGDVISIVAAAALVSAMAVVALPVAKKRLF